MIQPTVDRALLLSRKCLNAPPKRPQANLTEADPESEFLLRCATLVITDGFLERKWQRRGRTSRDYGASLTGINCTFALILSELNIVSEPSFPLNGEYSWCLRHRPAV